MTQTASNIANKTVFDDARAQAFAGRFLTALNEGALCLMVSIGHRTGLFDGLRGQPPASSEEIAARTDLNERYVREWLGAMVTAGVMEFDPAGKRYWLPDEHAAALTRVAGADNMAVFAQYIGVLGGVEDDIVTCFREGGGVPYDRYPRFHEVMAEDSGQSVLSSIDSHILPLVPDIVARLEQGIEMLDLGCGRGRILLHLAQRFPNSRFTGLDLSAPAIAHAQRQAERLKLTNVIYRQRDLSDFDQVAELARYDFITTFDAVHDQARPLNLLKGIQRALKKGGVYLMQDISGTSHVHKDCEHPIGTFLYTISCMHCMTVSLAQGGEGLGAMWGEEKTHDYLKRAGFSNVVTHKLAHDIQNNWYVVRK